MLFCIGGFFFVVCRYDTNLVGSNSPERPVSAVFGVFIDDRRLPSFITRVGLNRRLERGTKTVLSIAGAKIRRFLVSTKFRHVIRSDFQQLTI